MESRRGKRTYFSHSMLSVYFYFLKGVFLVYLFILRERDRKYGRGRERQRERERIPSRLCAVSAEPDVGLDPTNHEVMT